MKLPAKAVTLQELQKMIDAFLSDECRKSGGRLLHKKCGGGIRTGFANLFHLNNDGSLDPGSDGFGIGPKRVPYCENCDPPDGCNHTYARRVSIKRDPIEKPKRGKLTRDDVNWLTGTGRHAQ